MPDVRQTEAFRNWLTSLGDIKGRARILARIDSVTMGNFGDVGPVGEGISELRIHFGPGYRVYFTRRSRMIVLLLIGGSKSTQKRDIKTAKVMARELGKE